MDALDLDVEERVRIEPQVQLFGDEAAERDLVGAARQRQLLVQRRVVGVLGEFGEEFGVVERPLADGADDDVGQPRDWPPSASGER